jgi:hypothetical protein
MKTQLSSFARRLIAFVVSFLSNPQRVRLVVSVIVVALALAVLIIPALTTYAAPTSGGGGFAAVRR